LTTTRSPASMYPLPRVDYRIVDRVWEDQGSMSSKSAGSELVSMMALVAGVVAAVILVFFGLGYLFGSLFL